jgi:hypothetical protein
MTVPRSKLINAQQIMEQKMAQQPLLRAVGGLFWEERGPSNVGGRTRALLYDLNDAANGYKKVWAGSAGGGLWYTNNIEVTTPQWHRVNDLMGNLAVTAIAQNPSNTQVMYAGTGEGWFNSDAIQGLGIWKSTDGGVSWNQLSATNNSNFYHIQRVVVTSSGTVLASTRANGLYRSIDAGVSWTKVLGSGVTASTDRAADIEIASDGKIYATMGIFNGDGIYRSADDGINWTKIYTAASDENRIELGCAPANADVIYALVHDANGVDDISSTADDNSIKKIMKTINATSGTPTWSSTSLPSWCDQGSASTDFTRNQAWYDLAVRIDPSDENTVYVGGVDILKSTNGGTSWTQLTQWSNNCGGGALVHADIHEIIFKPGSSTDLLTGNDGGIYRNC